MSDDALATQRREKLKGKLLIVSVSSGFRLVAEPNKETISP
jgi:hypothetical protein